MLQEASYEKWLKRLLIGLGALVGLLVIVVIGAVVYIQLTWDNLYDRSVPQVTAPTTAEAVARGEYIFKYTAICWMCHGSGEDINAAPAGGFEFDLRKVGPPGGFGVFYASNLTPDSETGLGAWSDGEIFRALREGLSRDGRVLQLMPFEWYTGMSDADLLSIVAYLKSLPPVHNPIPANRINFVPKALLAFKVIKPQTPVDEIIIAPAEGPTVEYGQYLSSHLSSCAECHTPRNPQTGQFLMDQPFTGQSLRIEEEGVSVQPPNITPDQETGIGSWSEDQFLTALRTGMRPDGTVIMPLFMPWLIYKDLSDDDLRAIYRYLRSLPATSNDVPPSEVGAGETGATKGKAVYKGYCSSCHGEHGDGTFITEISLRQLAAAGGPSALEPIIRDG
ncbi:MAG: c-type cytochrome, partial [Dehalococcoidia bacterium]